MKTKTKAFDCVAMKRRASLRIYNKTKHMSLEQEIDYWRKRNEDFHKKQQSLRSQKPVDRG